MATTTFPTRDDFAALLNESLGGENENFEGKVVKGIVTGIENDMAVIDVGLKSEGRVPLREFAAPGQKAEIKVGDEVEVYVDRVENSHGEAMLSRDRARREAAWDKLEKEFDAGNRVEGVIFGRVKGRFTVGVLDAVDIDLDLVTNLDFGFLAGRCKFAQSHAAFRFQADVDDREIILDRGDGALDDAPFKTFILTAQMFGEQRGEIIARRVCHSGHRG